MVAKIKQSFNILCGVKFRYFWNAAWLSANSFRCAFEFPRAASSNVGAALWGMTRTQW